MGMDAMNMSLGAMLCAKVTPLSQWKELKMPCLGEREKLCKGSCGEMKLLTEFDKHPVWRNKRNTVCRKCET